MAMAKASIIIPVCNGETYLRQCLDSIANQTMKDFEVVCVNDGSTDASGAILSEYASKDARFRVHSQQNAGVGVARNRGLEISKGEYVLFVDADDELCEADALERLVDLAEREGLDALFFDAATRFDEGMSASPSLVRAEEYIRRHDYSAARTGRELFAQFLRHGEFTPVVWLAVLRRGFLERGSIRFREDNVFYEDNIFTTHVLLAAERARHVPWQLYCRRVHAGSIVTSAPTPRHLRGYLACFTDVCETLSGGTFDRRTRAALVDRRTVYRMHLRKMAWTHPDMAATAERGMRPEELSAFRTALEYPFSEKVANAIRCLKEHGALFTVRRILLGRQKA
ncbi:MAG: glycosyltransferase [Kiritimatiellae bacterium]|nr:glycosyltransferase [Kiritimatiellia bacterium]